MVKIEAMERLNQRKKIKQLRHLILIVGDLFSNAMS